jgi:hypothetical protein
MSYLGEYLQAIRVRHNISAVKAAYRAQMLIDEYLEAERTPERLRGAVLLKVLMAVEMTDEEYLDFSDIALHTFRERGFEWNPLTDLRELDAGASMEGVVLKFRDPAGPNARSLSKTKKADTGGE